MGGYGLTPGSADLRSAGPITFGPDGILFVADNASAKVYALDVADSGPADGSGPFELQGLDGRLASYLGCQAEDVTIRDMAVHPASHNVYLSVHRGGAGAGQAVLMRLDRGDGSMADVPLVNVPVAEVTIADAPAEDDARQDITLPQHRGEGEDVRFGERTVRVVRRPQRSATVTDMAYVDGVLFVAGLCNEEFASKLRRIPFPFRDQTLDNHLEIFHVSHGRWETAAPIRTFVPYDGGQAILACYTCTPLVHFPLSALTPGAKAVGRTVAELGNHNQPLDMVSFGQGGEEHLLVANSNHGLIRIDCRDIDGQAALTEPKEPVGVPRQTEDVQGVTRLANLNGQYVLAVQADEAGRRHLRSLATAAL